MLLAGKSILITGAAHRIGAQVARTLHENGANLIIHYRRSAQVAEALVAELEHCRKGAAIALQADLDDVTAIRQLAKDAISAFGGLDVLINNASEFFPTPVGSIEPEHWDTLVNSNCRAPLFLSQACCDALKQQNGVIINMLDIYASTPLRNHSVYCSAKAASQMMVKSLALELAPEIRVNGIAPGAILWPGDSEVIDNEDILKKIPLQRRGDTQSIANTVLFIITNDYLNGEIIRVDGGRRINCF